MRGMFEMICCGQSMRPHAQYRAKGCGTLIQRFRCRECGKTGSQEAPEGVPMVRHGPRYGTAPSASEWQVYWRKDLLNPTNLLAN